MHESKWVFPTRQQTEPLTMSKTWEAGEWARPLSGAKGVEKCLYLHQAGYILKQHLCVKTMCIHSSVFSFSEISLSTLILQNNRKMVKALLLCPHYFGKQQNRASQPTSGMERDRQRQQMRHQMRQEESHLILKHCFVHRCYASSPAF